jgi:hypothetical protein
MTNYEIMKLAHIALLEIWSKAYDRKLENPNEQTIGREKELRKKLDELDILIQKEEAEIYG